MNEQMQPPIETPEELETQATEQAEQAHAEAVDQLETRVEPVAEDLETQPEAAPAQPVTEAAEAIQPEPAEQAEAAAQSPAETPAAVTEAGATAAKRPGKGERSEKAASERNPARSVGFIALPVEISQLAKKHQITHPGLVLGKYAVLLRLQDKRLQYDFGLEQKKRILQKTASLLASDSALQKTWEAEKQARNAVLQATQAQQVQFTTTSPLVFASAHPLANLGVNLHPIFGFPQLEAQDIKGALRRFVQESWLPSQADASSSQQLIDRVFGQAGKEDQTAEVVFHDAWPENWPTLSLEQAVNHHSPYYQRREAPGDWQMPSSECFLVIKPGARFGFSWSALRPDTPAEVLSQVESWLRELLATQGLGAYRQQGYGLFKTNYETAAETHEAKWQTRLQLNSPAFLAGASQRPEDCRLRPGMLRGLLRWWWRTMHSGFLGHRELQALESVIWGSERRKGAVRLVLDAEQSVQSRRYRPEDLLRQLPAAEARRRSPGLVYLGYGFFSENAKRYYMPQEASWNLQVEARPVVWQNKEQQIELSREQVLEQVQAALWLLCHYGGLGQRKRKGFGSLQELQGLELNEDRCLEIGSALRSHCGLTPVFADDKAESPSLMQRIELADMPTPWKNPWFVLHQLGESLQTFMQGHKHEAQKKALGLPRVMAPPLTGEFAAAAPVQDRHAAPYFLHLVNQADGNLSVRVVAFPAAKLPDQAESQRLLSTLVQHLRSDLAARVELSPTEPEIDLSTPAPTRERPARRQAVRPGEARPERPFRPRPQGEAAGFETSGSPAPRRGRSWPAGGDGGAQRTPGERGERSERSTGRPERGSERPARRPAREPLELTHWTEKPSRRNQTSENKPRRTGGLPQAGDWIEAVLLEERTKKGGWRAQHASSKLGGPVVNTSLIPGDCEAGAKVDLIVHASNKLEMMFRWPTEKELQQRDKASQKAAQKSK